MEEHEQKLIHNFSICQNPDIQREILDELDTKSFQEFRLCVPSMQEATRRIAKSHFQNWRQSPHLELWSFLNNLQRLLVIKKFKTIAKSVGRQALRKQLDSGNRKGRGAISEKKLVYGRQTSLFNLTNQ